MRRRAKDGNKPMTKQYLRVMAEAAALFRDSRDMTADEIEARQKARLEGLGG